MERITIDDSFRLQLDKLAVPVVVCDRTGRKLGHFVPVPSPRAVDECPYNDAELAHMKQEEGGHALSAIWKSLGVR